MENEILIQSADNLRKKLYVIRGVQVMLDRDLAEIYGYTVKAFNQQVKNNIEKFAEDFRFQLTDEEATKFLQDFQYYAGYRKWDGGNLTYVQEALEVYNGTRIFYLESDGEVWNVSLEEAQNNPYFDKIQRI
jgi:glucose-6-phosphate 1-dehydrogenase